MTSKPKTIRRTRLSSAVLLFACLAVPAIARTAECAEFHGSLSKLPTCNQVLGEGWNGPNGLVVDDLNDLTSVKQQERRTVEDLAKQLASENVIAFADFSYTRKDVPRIVTVRVFVFKDAGAAEAWWHKKYESQGWEKLYEKAPGLGERAVKSKQQFKEIVVKDNVWITAHQLHDGNEFHQALVHYLKHLTEPEDAARTP